MTLTEDELNALDEKILDVLTDGRATPTLIKMILEERGTEVSRQYINQRMKRLSEHDHIENLFDTGVYELVIDPR
jgi:repressor of nif and glnA expression